MEGIIAPERNKWTQLAAIQRQLKVGKPNFNKFGGFKYRSCEDILEAVKPLLTKHGVALTLNDDIQVIGERHYVRAIAQLVLDDGNSITISSYAREPLEKKGMDASQITGAASSYARKTALAGMFLLDDGNDIDSTDGINLDEIIKEVNQCTTTDELNAHFKAHREIITKHNLTVHYEQRKKEL